LVFSNLDQDDWAHSLYRISAICSAYLSYRFSKLTFVHTSFIIEVGTRVLLGNIPRSNQAFNVQVIILNFEGAQTSSHNSDQIFPGMQYTTIYTGDNENKERKIKTRDSGFLQGPKSNKRPF
jgi:hypothetical protein